MVNPLPQVTRRAVLKLVARVLGSVLGLLLLYFLLPMDEGLSPRPVLFLSLGLIALAILVVFQVRSILGSDTPGLRAIESLAVSVPLLVIMFATLYFVASYQDLDSFSEPLDKADALYFAMTTFSTTGFGDIAAVSQTMRLVVTAQMAIDLVVIGFGIRIVISAAKIGRARTGQVVVDDV
jgi:voltage-gated potassium channel